MNVLSLENRILMFETGYFATLRKKIAEKLGLGQSLYTETGEVGLILIR